MSSTIECLYSIKFNMESIDKKITLVWNKENVWLDIFFPQPIWFAINFFGILNKVKQGNGVVLNR